MPYTPQPNQSKKKSVIFVRGTFYNEETKEKVFIPASEQEIMDFMAQVNEEEEKTGRRLHAEEVRQSVDKVKGKAADRKKGPK